MSDFCKRWLREKSSIVFAILTDFANERLVMNKNEGSNIEKKYVIL